MQLTGPAQITGVTAAAPVSARAGTLERLLDRVEGTRPAHGPITTAAQIEHSLGAVDGRVRAVYTPV